MGVLLVHEAGDNGHRLRVPWDLERLLGAPVTPAQVAWWWDTSVAPPRGGRGPWKDTPQGQLVQSPRGGGRGGETTGRSGQESGLGGRSPLPLETGPWLEPTKPRTSLLRRAGRTSWLKAVG